MESRRKKKIQKNYFVLESTHGDSVGGHIFYLIKEIQRQVEKCKVFVVSKQPEKHKKFLEEKGFSNIQIVKHLSEEYYELLAVAEYLINDTTFYPFFNKRKDQKYYIIWHGTPLKNMGKDMEIVVDVANVQRNFYMADKIIVSNEHTKDVLVESHNLKNVYPGKVVVGPSPRNSVFFDKALREKVREDLELVNKKVISYMPTWRGTVGKVRKSSEVEKMLNYLDKFLDENTILYVKLHDFEKNSIKNTYRNIRFFPDNYETYEFLTATDALITDYSSVMYDYLNLNKPVILYTYDLEEYANTRGMYEDLTEYPFVNTETLEDLERAINKVDSEINYANMKQRFTKYDHHTGSFKITKNILNGYTDDSILEYDIHNGKETVAILSGGFWNNGVTTALINTLENIDTTKRNYICFFEKSKVKPEHYYRLLNLPENVLFYPTTGELNGNLQDRLLVKKYLWDETYSAKARQKQLKRIYKEEFTRLFGDVKIDWMIHYTGFERKEAEMMRHIDAKTAIWVHTDMFEEYKAKSNFSRKIVFGAYKDVDKIVLVHNNLKENLVKNIKGISYKITTVNNFLGENRTRNLGNEGLFNSLEGVKVDYSFNDNAYKSKNQMYLEQFKEDIQTLLDEVKNKKNINFQLVLDKIVELSMDYKVSDYLTHVVNKEIEMINQSVNNLKNIFNDNEDLAYKLAFEEFEKEILPKLKDKEDELHFDFPDLNEKLEQYRISTIEEDEAEEDIEVNKQNHKLSSHAKKLILDSYQTLKREKDLSTKFNDLFEGQFDKINDYINQYVLENENQLSKKPIFDFYNHFRISKVKLLNAIYNKDVKVYINIGRYDYQKGHDKLIEAFEDLYEVNQNIFLVLVCPHGPLKSKTINRVRNSSARECIVILGGMNNPYPLLSHCDAFVLSSNYEGLGLVVYEALALKTDVITVDLPETIQYLEENQAIIVDNNAKGIYNGLYKHRYNQYDIKEFDFEPLRQSSIKEFENVFK
ncbi:CDP-glycerol glycerophosphotransferase family protein [Staphylococcus pasteuri]|uniref:CDP-glycerol glycerophosphotransferase family protein n=1 Tax=Staphylococcus pasteuri TaxID=45972 RepID=UPI003144E3DD